MISYCSICITTPLRLRSAGRVRLTLPTHLILTGFVRVISPGRVSRTSTGVWSGMHSLEKKYTPLELTFSHSVEHWPTPLSLNQRMAIGSRKRKRLEARRSTPFQDLHFLSTVIWATKAKFAWRSDSRHRLAPSL